MQIFSEILNSKLIGLTINLVTALIILGISRMYYRNTCVLTILCTHCLLYLANNVHDYYAAGYFKRFFN